MYTNQEIKKLTVDNSQITRKSIYDVPNGIRVFYGNSFFNEKNKLDIVEKLFTYMYILDLYDTIKIINTKDDLFSFVTKYKRKNSEIKVYDMLDWNKIKQDYSGIIIMNNLKEKLWPDCSDEMSITGIESVQNFFTEIMGNRWKNHKAFLTLWLHKWQDNTGIIWSTEGIAKCRLIRINDYSQII